MLPEPGAPAQAKEYLGGIASTPSDQWGEPVAAGEEASVRAWDEAWGDLLHFRGDPLERLTEPNRADESFALGPVFCAAYRLLGGARPDSPEIAADLDRAGRRACTEREVGHAAAAAALAAGEFTEAGRRWEALARGTRDLAAVRLAHDVYLHVGDDRGKLRASAAAVGSWSAGDPGWGFVQGQHSFALEESGRYSEAERFGWLALEHDPLDLWALHALAHVYESTGDQAAALDLLGGRRETWSDQHALAVHVWWHLALRLMAAGRLDEALGIHDHQAPAATTAFSLCDLASLLWRLELAGADAGGRWADLADAFAVRRERHTCGFLDFHAALVYARCPDHPEASAFFSGVSTAHAGADSENADIFNSVVRPLVEAIRVGDADPAGALSLLDSIGGRLHRIGGSVVQRDLVGLTRTTLKERLGPATGRPSLFQSGGNQTAPSVVQPSNGPE